MNKIGIVRNSLSGQGVLVEIVDEEKLESSACKPSSCTTCESCGKKKFVVADIPIDLSDKPLQVGQWVEVYTATSQYTIAVIVTFILPLILLFFGIWLGRGDEKKSLLFGLLLFAFSLFFAYIFDKSFKAKVIITKVIERND